MEFKRILFIMYRDLDLGVDIMDQRQDRQKQFLCVMQILVKS